MVAQKNKTFATKSAKTPNDHKPAKDAVLEIETSVGVVKTHPLRITYGMMKELKDMSELDVSIKMIDSVVLEESQEIILDLDQDELEEFMDVLQEASGVQLGESSASSD